MGTQHKAKENLACPCPSRQSNAGPTRTHLHLEHCPAPLGISGCSYGMPHCSKLEPCKQSSLGCLHPWTNLHNPAQTYLRAPLCPLHPSGRSGTWHPWGTTRAHCPHGPSCSSGTPEPSAPRASLRSLHPAHPPPPPLGPLLPGEVPVSDPHDAAVRPTQLPQMCAADTTHRDPRAPGPARRPVPPAARHGRGRAASPSPAPQPTLNEA